MRFRSLIAVALTGAISSFGAVSLAPSASADTPGCVTRKEFKKVERGMSKNRVARIFDTKGRQSSSFRSGGDIYQTRKYNPCPRYSYVNVDYKNGHVKSKSAYFG